MSKEQQTFERFSIAERFEHLLLLITFSTLALTGLPQKFPLSPISEFFVKLLGGVEGTACNSPCLCIYCYPGDCLSYCGFWIQTLC